MANAGVPMTPENYAVFFASAKNRLPDLNAFIDHLFAERRPFTPELCIAIHHRFLNTAAGLEAVREANERLSRTLNTVQHDLGGGQAERNGLATEIDRVLARFGAIQSRLRRSERVELMG